MQLKYSHHGLVAGEFFRHLGKYTHNADLVAVLALVFFIEKRGNGSGAVCFNKPRIFFHRVVGKIESRNVFLKFEFFFL